MLLKDIYCPLCKGIMENLSKDDAEKHGVTYSYENCLRKCTKCEVGFSNAMSNPTLIYKNYSENIPLEVWDYLDTVISNALNERNRKTKLKRLGYNSSEDALTWTVFRYFQKRDKLSQLIQKAIETPSVGNASIYYWGVPLKNNGRIDQAKQKTLVKTLEDLGENKQSLSEPDIILEDDETIVIFEVKFGSSNDKQEATNKWEKYDNNNYFNKSILKNPALKEYQLVRNWCIGNLLAKKSGKRFTLVNLIFKDNNSNDLFKFKKTIKQTPKANFKSLNWQTLLKDIIEPDDSKWLISWLKTRKPKLDFFAGKVRVEHEEEKMEVV